jgi:hypothetical protein
MSRVVSAVLVEVFVVYTCTENHAFYQIPAKGFVVDLLMLTTSQLLAIKRCWLKCLLQSPSDVELPYRYTTKAVTSAAEFT